VHTCPSKQCAGVHLQHRVVTVHLMLDVIAELDTTPDVTAELFHRAVAEDNMGAATVAAAKLPAGCPADLECRTHRQQKIRDEWFAKPRPVDDLAAAITAEPRRVTLDHVVRRVVNADTPAPVVDALIARFTSFDSWDRLLFLATRCSTAHRIRILNSVIADLVTSTDRGYLPHLPDLAGDDVVDAVINTDIGLVHTSAVHHSGTEYTLWMHTLWANTTDSSKSSALIRALLHQCDAQSASIVLQPDTEYCIRRLARMNKQDYLDVMDQWRRLPGHVLATRQYLKHVDDRVLNARGEVTFLPVFDPFDQSLTSDMIEAYMFTNSTQFHNPVYTLNAAQTAALYAHPAATSRVRISLFDRGGSSPDALLPLTPQPDTDTWIHLYKRTKRSFQPLAVNRFWKYCPLQIQDDLVTGELACYAFDVVLAGCQRSRRYRDTVRRCLMVSHLQAARPRHGAVLAQIVAATHPEIFSLDKEHMAQFLLLGRDFTGTVSQLLDMVDILSRPVAG